jgi:hypothetical protein
LSNHPVKLSEELLTILVTKLSLSVHLHTQSFIRMQRAYYNILPSVCSWERPETMDTPRTVYQINQDNPGTDLAAESAAALAAASIAFRSSDGSYADTLLSTARQLFTFADTCRGAYSDSIPQVGFGYPIFVLA